MQGWNATPTYADRERYLASLGSVCALWRSLLITDPRLWTSIYLSDASGVPISPRDEERIATLVARSGSLPLHVRTDITDGVRTESLKRCLTMLKAELHRCESVDITTNCITGWEDSFPLEGSMPLLKSMRVTSALRSSPSSMIDSRDAGLHSAWASQIPITLFANTPHNLESLHINMEHPHVADLSHINPCTLRTLSLHAYIPHKQALAFVQACERLESLDLELYADDEEEMQRLGGALDQEAEEEADVLEQVPEARKAEDEMLEGIHCPQLKDLSVYGPSAMMLSSIIDAPALEHLNFNLADESQTFALAQALLQGAQSSSSSLSGSQSSSFGSTTTTSAYPHLRTLNITGEYFLYAPADAIAEFVTSGAHDELESVSITNFVNASEVLELLAESPPSPASLSPALSRSSSLSSLSSLSSVDSPSTGTRARNASLPQSLTSLTILDSPSGDQTYPPISSLAPPLSSLLELNERLNVEWVHPEPKETSRGVRGNLVKEMPEGLQLRVKEVLSAPPVQIIPVDGLSLGWDDDDDDF